MTTKQPTPCDVVAERFALGEALGEFAEHADTCAACQALRTTATAVGVTKHDVEPGMGFAARMTVAAQKRLVERKRNRVVGGLAATVLAGTVGVFFVTRGPGALPDRPDPATSAKAPTNDDKLPTPDPAADDAAARALAKFMDVDTNEHLSARWHHIEQPLRAVKRLVKGTK